MDLQLKRKSIALALLVHGVLFLILLFTFLHTKIPPFGGGGGGMSSLGLIEIASGDEQPMSNNQIVKEVPVEASASQTTEEEEIATQDVEEAPAVVIKNEKKKKSPEPVTAPVKEKPKEKPKPVQKVDPVALYKGKTTSGSQGSAQTGKGDQGTPTGDPRALYSGNNGSGTGSGSGSGSGIGDGNGSGIGSGDGFSFNLSGRKIFKAPQIEDNSQETGRVVIDITVDKYGNVTNATGPGRGSTTTSGNLYKKAREAAFRAKFSACIKDDCAEEQRGTITFVFIVQ